MIRQAGISLLEMIVVIAIIAITGSLAAPGMSTWSCKRTVKNDLASVTNMLEVQRQKALNGAASYGVTIRQTNPTISFNQYSSAWCGAAQINSSILTLDKLRLVGPSDAFCFEPDGTATANSNNYGWYMQASCGGISIDYRVRVFQATGYMLVEQKDQSSNKWNEI